jgi:hypothetical protein
MRSVFSCIVLFLGCAGVVLAQSVAPAIITDTPADRAHPAAMTVLHIPSHGLLINGLLYSSAGAGPHATLVICHGLPGNEKNPPRAQEVAAMADESMVDELAAHAKEFVVGGTAAGLAQIPVLAITANDHLAAQTDTLVAAIRARGGTRITATHLDTDHSYSDRRIALESIVITWLSGLN